MGPAGQTAYGGFGGRRPPAPAQPGRPAGRGFCSSPTRRKGRICPLGSASPPVYRKGQIWPPGSAPPPPAERGGFARRVLPLPRFSERGRLAFSPFAGRQGAADGSGTAAPCAGRQRAPGTAPQGPRRSCGKGAGAARPLRRPEAGALRGPLLFKRAAARNATPPREFN